jgi:Ring finger domain
MVCLQEFKPTDDVRVLICFHVFHGSCIMEWFKNKLECPLCKFDICSNEDSVITSHNGQVLKYKDSIGSKHYLKNLTTAPNTDTASSMISTVTFQKVKETTKTIRKKISHQPSIMPINISSTLNVSNISISSIH